MSADSQRRYKGDRQILRQLAGLIICNRLMPPAYGHRVRQTVRQADRQTDRVETVSQLVRLATPTWNGQRAKQFPRAANRCLAYEMSSDSEHDARGTWCGARDRTCQTWRISSSHTQRHATPSAETKRRVSSQRGPLEAFSVFTVIAMANFFDLGIKIKASNNSNNNNNKLLAQSSPLPSPALSLPLLSLSLAHPLFPIRLACHEKSFHHASLKLLRFHFNGQIRSVSPTSRRTSSCSACALSSTLTLLRLAPTFASAIGPRPSCLVARQISDKPPYKLFAPDGVQKALPTARRIRVFQLHKRIDQARRCNPQ